MKSGVEHDEQAYLIIKWNTILTVIGLDNGVVHYWGDTHEGILGWKIERGNRVVRAGLSSGLRRVLCLQAYPT